jgi:hypothetical protein
MLREFMLPLVTLCGCAIGGIAGLDRLCLFHQTYQAMVSKLQSERWLLEQCADPHFFSKMHQHSDLCFQARSLMIWPSVIRQLTSNGQVENNARVGAFMLSLRQVTQSVLPLDALAALGPLRAPSWPLLLCAAGGLLVLAPSWLAGRRRWPACADGHFKDA